MNPLVINGVIFGLEEIIKLEPAVAAEITSIFSNPNATAQDWANLRATIAAKSYASYDPAPLPPDAVTIAAQNALSATTPPSVQTAGNAAVPATANAPTVSGSPPAAQETNAIASPEGANAVPPAPASAASATPAPLSPVATVPPIVVTS